MDTPAHQIPTVGTTVKIHATAPRQRGRVVCIGGSHARVTSGLPRLERPQGRDHAWGAKPRRVSLRETSRERVGRVGDGQRESVGPADPTESGLSRTKQLDFAKSEPAAQPASREVSRSETRPACWPQSWASRPATRPGAPRHAR